MEFFKREPKIHYHRLNGTWHTETEAKEIQGRENTQDFPVEIFKEFWECGHLMEKV